MANKFVEGAAEEAGKRTVEHISESTDQDDIEHAKTQGAVS